MKTLKITYWTLTAIIALMMTYSAYAYLTDATIKQGFVQMGFPDYFRIELAIAKILGAATLLLPVSKRLKEWAYAGFGIVFISAFIAHVSSGHPSSMYSMPVFFLMILMGSYLTYQKLGESSVKDLNMKHA